MNSKEIMFHRTTAFSLTELMVVLVIIGVLVLLALPKFFFHHIGKKPSLHALPEMTEFEATATKNGFGGMRINRMNSILRGNALKCYHPTNNMGFSTLKCCHPTENVG